MRICIDATPLLLKSAGVKNYLYHWIRHLQRVAGEGGLETFPFTAPLGPLDHERSTVGRWATLTGLARLHLANRSGLPLLDRLGQRLDVFHACNLLRRPPSTCRITATLYDLTCWLMPEMHTRANVAATKRFAARVLQRADGLVAISASARADAVRILELNAERIEVIHPGVAAEFFVVPEEAVTTVRARYGLARPYVLFVGTIEPRKNLGALLDAWQGLAAELRREYELVIAGPAGWAERRVGERLRASGGGLRYLAYVPEPDLPGLTAGATLFVYPSLYEGFGFPVVQAMAAGVPVITSNVSSLPEVTAGGAVLIDPRSVAELRAALERLLEAPAERAALAARGRQVASQYRWESCARKSLEFFQRVAGGGVP